MKRMIFVLLIGLALGIVVTLPLTVVAGSSAVTKLTGPAAAPPAAQQMQEKPPQPGQAHQRMHEMMDSMMGEGSSDWMRQSMLGSEEMMERCAKHMEDMDGGGMEGMMGMIMNESMKQEMMQDSPSPGAKGMNGPQTSMNMAQTRSDLNDGGVTVGPTDAQGRHA